jgi:hypothetical protein
MKEKYEKEIKSQTSTDIKQRENNEISRESNVRAIQIHV